MLNLCISQTLVQAELDEIFRRIEYADTPEIREHEANYAWFQIYGMLSILKTGELSLFAQVEKPDAAHRHEYEEIRQTLEAALKRAERVFEAYCDRPTKSTVSPEQSAHP